MKKYDLKKILLGKFGVGLLLILLQILIGVEANGTVPYLIGSNIMGVAGLCLIIDELINIKIKKHRKSKKILEQHSDVKDIVERLKNN